MWEVVGAGARAGLVGVAVLVVEEEVLRGRPRLRLGVTGDARAGAGAEAFSSWIVLACGGAEMAASLEIKCCWSFCSARGSVSCAFRFAVRLAALCAVPAAIDSAESAALGVGTFFFRPRFGFSAAVSAASLCLVLPSSALLPTSSPGVSSPVTVALPSLRIAKTSTPSPATAAAPSPSFLRLFACQHSINSSTIFFRTLMGLKP